MPIFFECPRCGKIYRLHEIHAGKAAACGCGEHFRIPAAKTPAHAPAADEAPIHTSVTEPAFASTPVDAPLADVAEQTPLAASAEVDDAFFAEADEAPAAAEGEDAAGEPAAVFAEEADAGMPDDSEVAAGELPASESAAEAEAEDESNEGKEQPKDDFVAVRPQGKRGLFARLLLLLGALGLAGAFFLPFWPMPASWETPAIQANLQTEAMKPAESRAKGLVPPQMQTGLQITKNGVKLDRSFYALPAGAALALLLALLGLAGLRIGRFPALVLALLAAGGALIGGVLILRCATGVLPVMQIIKEIGDPTPLLTQHGFVLWAAGVLLTTVGGLWAALTSFQRLPITFRHRKDLRDGEDFLPTGESAGEPEASAAVSRPSERTSNRELTPAFTTESPAEEPEAPAEEPAAPVKESAEESDAEPPAQPAKEIPEEKDAAKKAPFKKAPLKMPPFKKPGKKAAGKKK